MSGFFTESHKNTTDLTQKAFTGKVATVSFSSLNTFEKCPYSVYLGKVQGITGVGSTASDRGSLLHSMLEEYVLGTTNEIEWGKLKSKQYHAPIIDTFRKEYKKQNCIPELQLAFTKNMKLTTWDATDCWLRGAIDVLVFNNKNFVTIYDYKSGSNQSAALHRTQLMLYAMMIFFAYPKINKIDATAIYLDHRIANFYTHYNRNDVEIYWPRFKTRLLQVTDCKNFQPNPNGFSCLWCQHKTTQPTLNQVEPACKFAYIG